MSTSKTQEELGSMVAYVRIERGPFQLEDGCVTPHNAFVPRAPGADSELLPTGAALLSHRGSHVEVMVSRAMSGVALRNGVAYGLDELWEAGSIAAVGQRWGRMVLQMNDRLTLKSGAYQIQVDVETKVEAGAMPLKPSEERRSAPLYGIASVALHMSVLLLAFMIPAQGSALDLDDELEIQSRYMGVDTFAQVPVPPKAERIQVEKRSEHQGQQAPVLAPKANRSTPGPMASKAPRPSRPSTWSHGKLDGHRKASNVGVMGIFARQGTLTTGDLDRATRTMDVGAPMASPAFGLPDGRGGVPIPGGRPEQRFVIGTGDWMDGTHKKPRTKGIEDGILDERPEGSKAIRRPPKFTPGPVVVQGALPRSVIRTRILAHRARFRYCYEQGLQRKPGLQGRAVVNFTIAHTGRVTTAHVASTLGDAGVQQCISRSVQRLTFPSFPEGVVRVRYPFTFAPGSTH